MRPKWLYLAPPLAVYFALGLQPLAVTAPLPAPVLFFSDLDSGPAAGNSDTTNTTNGGVYVTLYGNFLTSPSVTLNGASCLITVSQPSPWLWYQKMTVQLRSTCTSGNFVVTTSAGTSNGLAFTVRSGNIRYVKSTGNDSNTGTFQSPWLTLLHARDTIAAGDTIYSVGVSQTTEDSSGWGSSFTLYANGGTAGNPKAILVYPGSSATIGSIAPAVGVTGIRSAGNGNSNWTFAGFTLLGQDVALQSADDGSWRVIGNDMSCPNGNSQSGCLDTGGCQSGVGGCTGSQVGSHDMKIWGNHIHNIGTNNNPTQVTALYHGWYLSETVGNIDIGWNSLHDVYGGRCLQQNVNIGRGSYGLLVHDNIIHDCQNDGILMNTVNPAAGSVQIYNNVIYNAGKGPTNADHQGAWSCIDLFDAQQIGASNESGQIEVYNNTLYACGTNPSPEYPQANAGLLWTKYVTGSGLKTVRLRNNIFYQTTGPASGYPYINVDPGATGSNNLFFGNGTPPSEVTQSVNSNPLFVNAGADFHLASASPANGAGTAAAPVAIRDNAGLIRPSPPSIGALEFAAGVGSSGPNPPSDLTIVVR